MSVDYKPATMEPKPAAAVSVRVEPTGEVFRIGPIFDIQPELKVDLPKELQKETFQIIQGARFRTSAWQADVGPPAIAARYEPVHRSMAVVRNR